MKSWKRWVIIAVVALVVILSCVFIVQGSSNSAIAKEERIEAAMSEIKVQEKRRADLIPNLVDCVKQYDQHEYETLMAIVAGRNTEEEKTNAVYAEVQAVAEAYPELKSSEQYTRLMSELSVTENMISQSRDHAVTRIRDYRRFVKKFPTRFFLVMSGYEVKDYEYLDYEASSDAPTDLFAS